MPTASRTAAAALLVSLHMVLHCSGKIPSIQQRKDHVKIQEGQLNSTNQSTEEATTVIPASSYIFSAEEYDILQDAESLQKALTIVAYEPQKIDAKKPKLDAITGNATIVILSSVQSTTETPPEKQYYEVPRRALRSHSTHAKPADDASTEPLSGESSAPGHVYEFASEENRHSISHPRVEPDSTPSPSPVPLTTERTTTAQPHSSSETPSTVKRDRRKLQFTKDAETPEARIQVQPIQSTTRTAPHLAPRPFSMPTDASPMSSNRHDRHYEVTSKPVDLQPIASAESPGTQSFLSPRRSVKNGRSKPEPTASSPAPVERLYQPSRVINDYFSAPTRNQVRSTPYSTVHRDHSTPRSTPSTVRRYSSQYSPGQKHGSPYSSAPVDPIPPRQRPSTPHTTAAPAQRRTTTYPTESIDQSPRHSKRVGEQWEYDEPRAADREAGVGTPTAHQEETQATQGARSRVRLDRTTTTVAPDEQTLGYGSVPVRSKWQSGRQSNEVYRTAPTWKEEVQARPPVKSRRVGRPPRREDDPSYSEKSSKSEEPSIGYSSKSPRIEEEKAYSTKSPRRGEDWSYSTKSPRREEKENYSTESSRKEKERYYSLKKQDTYARPTSAFRRDQKNYPSNLIRAEEKQVSSTASSSQSEEQDYSTVPSANDDEQSYSFPSSLREYSENYQTTSTRRPSLTIVDHPAAPKEEVAQESTRSPSSHKSLSEDDEDYEQDEAPLATSAEEGLDDANDPPPTQAQKQPEKRPTEYQEYVDTTDYADYTEPRPKEKLEDQEKNQDKGREKDDDVKPYSFSYVERVETPLDESGEASYDVHEVSEEEPEQPQPRPAGTHAAIQRGGYQIIQPNKLDHDEQPRQQKLTTDDEDQKKAAKVEREVTQETRQPQHKPKDEKAEDLAQSAGHEHKKEEKPKKKDEEEGGHAEHHEGEHHEKGHKGDKDYKEHHEHHKAEKGHHDKEDHDHHYDEKKGGQKKHHDEAAHHEEHHKGEEGEKKHAFSEKGKHKKGHSTKGEHVIHKKDAFEKKIEFFDEFHEDGDHEKHGAQHHEHHHKKGGHHHKGHHHKGEHEGHHGKKGHYEKGHDHHEKQGHKKEVGGHQHHDHHHKFGKKGGHEDHKHWHHKKE